MSDLFYVSYGLLWLVVVSLAILVVLVYRHFGLMAMETGEGVSRDGLGVGRVAPPVRGFDGRAEEAHWAHSTERPSLLLFASPECEPCVSVLPYVRSLAGEVSVTSIVAGDTHDAARMQEAIGATFGAIAEGSEEIFDLYRVKATPFGFVVGTDGRIRSKGLCNSKQNLQHLLVAAGLPELGVRLDAEHSHGPLVAITHNGGST